MRITAVLVASLLCACATQSIRSGQSICGGTEVDVENGALVFQIERIDPSNSRPPDCAGALVAWDGGNVYVQVFCQRPEQVADTWSEVQEQWPGSFFVPARARHGKLAVSIPFTHLPDGEQITVWRLIDSGFTNVVSFPKPAAQQALAADAAPRRR